MRMRKALPTLAIASSLLVGGIGLPRQAAADVSFSISLGDDRFDQFRGGLQSYFGVPEDQILLMDRRGLSGYEAPIALYISRQARVSPMQVLDLRQRGMHWHDIVGHYGLSPDIFYVSMDDDFAGQYWSIYNRPRSQWDQAYLSDEDYMNLANLKFMTEYYGYEPDRIIRLRSEGRDFLTIANLVADIVGTGSRSSYGYGYDESSMAGDLLGSFLYAAASQFNRPYDEVYLLHDRGLRESEIPVALYIASRAGIDPIRIVDLRRTGMSWYDITRRYSLSPEIFYVPVDDYYGDPVYGSAYDLFRRYPRSQWDRVRLSDEQFVNLANLRFLSERYQTPPEQVIRLRRQGNDFMHITRQFQQQRGEQVGVNARPAQRQQRVEQRQDRREQERMDQSRMERRQERQEAAREQNRQDRLEQERMGEIREQRRQERQEAAREQNRQDRLEQERRGEMREQRRQERQEAAREQRAEQESQQQVREEQRQQRQEAREEQRQQRQEVREDERPRKRNQGQNRRRGNQNDGNAQVGVGTP